MRKRLAAELDIDVDSVSIKAKTGEGLDSIGTSQAIRAEACILLRKSS
jgi:2-C-methyl-D-erythritol 2,4-cyclodiphosphate synthase